MAVIIGVTGTIGSGKSTAGRLLEKAGVPVFDTDHMVHALLSENTPVRESVISRFGEQIRRPDGSVDRARLGAVVFRDPAARKELEGLVHPAVREEMRHLSQVHADKPVIAFLVPLLFETGLESRFDEVWTITADQESLKQRLKERDKISDEAIEQRLSAQMSQDEKAARATRVIDNSDTLENTERQILSALKEIETSEK